MNVNLLRNIDLSTLLGKIKNQYRSIHKVCSWNEWSPLEEVIVGNLDNATIPKLTVEVKACVPESQFTFFEKNGGKPWNKCVSKEFIKEAKNELSNFVNILNAEGVKVRRPISENFSLPYNTLHFSSTGLYSAMPRDVILIVGDEMIEATMTWRSRYHEINSYRHLLIEYWKNGAKWVAAPKPMYKDLFDESYRNSQTDEKFVTKETEPCFDAADFVRAGKDIFCQRSQVTNSMGINWVRHHLKNQGIQVHELHFKDRNKMHIDATFVPVQPGVVLMNSARPCSQYDVLKKAGWKLVPVPEPDPARDQPLWFSSHWIAMNTLMLDEKRVFVEKEEHQLQTIFKRLGIQPIALPMRFCNAFGGGFHCWTLDVKRTGVLESYCNWDSAYQQQYAEQYSN